MTFKLSKQPLLILQSIVNRGHHNNITPNNISHGNMQKVMKNVNFLIINFNTIAALVM